MFLMPSCQTRILWKAAVIRLISYIHCVFKNVYPSTTNGNFNSSCPIPVIFGTNIQILMPSVLWRCLQCFDAVGWAAGRASGL